MRTWLCIFGLALGTTVSNGFARFGYGLILPAMKSDLQWTYTTAGWVNTSNAIGYLIGSLLALCLNKRLAPAILFSYGMIATTIALLVSGVTSDFMTLTAMRLLAGIGGAPVFISGAAIVATTWPDIPSKNALAIAIYFAGAGFGIFITAISLPVLIDIAGISSWPYAWYFMGGLSVLACIPSILAARAMGAQVAHKTATKAALPIRRLLPSLTGYFLFSAGYIVYMTFVVALLKDQGAPVTHVILCWAVLGVGVMLSPYLWRAVLTKFNTGVPLALASLATGLGSLIPIISPSITGIGLSAFIFGASFFVAPTAVTAFSKKNLPKEQWGLAVALYTTVFAFGQTLGPVGAGWLADLVGDLAYAVIAGAFVLLSGSFLAIFQRALK